MRHRTRDGASGDGASGDGASGVGASGDGASGDGASGDGASGDGASGVGASGDGASGDGVSGDMETRTVQQRTFSLPSPHSYLRITISVNVTRQQQQQQPQRKGEQKGQQKGVPRGEQGGVQREVLERLLGDSLVALFGSVGAGSIQASLLVLSCDPCGPHSVAVLRCDKRTPLRRCAALPQAVSLEDGSGRGCSMLATALRTSSRCGQQQRPKASHYEPRSASGDTRCVCRTQCVLSLCECLIPSRPSRHEQQVWAAAAAMRHPTLNPSVQVVTLASSLLALANPTLHLPTP
ncbi:unnamed protein product [Closterium sp. Naga37s-1]|nr:unnamed protein product [Closterium sp. Naga37s-1]